MSTRSVVAAITVSLVFGVCALASAEGAASHTVAGAQLDAGEAENLEAILTRRPDDLVARTELLGYYSKHKLFRDKAARRSRARHILWLIRNHPQAEVLRIPEGHIQALLDPDGYAQCKEAWLEQLKAQPESVPVLTSSAAFFLQNDRDLAQDSLQKACALDKANPKWPAALGQLYALDMIGASPEVTVEAATKALAQFELAYQLTKDPVFRLLHLTGIAKAAFAAGKLDRAKEAAEHMLRESDKSHSADSEIHQANIILGRVALRSGDAATAKKAGKVPDFGGNLVY
jgi:tetratricopeptide (TPR) repeat protein